MPPGPGSPAGGHRQEKKGSMKTQSPLNHYQPERFCRDEGTWGGEIH